MNPENTNDADQNAIKQNPDQNIMDQSAAFPGQNLQLVQSAFVQNLPLQTSPPKSKMLIPIACIVGVGLNVEKLKEGSGGMEYAINLYSRQYVADKANGRLHVIQTGENSTIENIKSIPITQREASSLLSM